MQETYFLKLHEYQNFKTLKHDKNKNLVVRNYVTNMVMYNVLPSSFKPPPLGANGCSLPILQRHLLQLMGYIML